MTADSTSQPTKKVDRFAARSDADLVKLLRQQPLTWVVSGSGETFRATLLPILAETDSEGRIVRLVGHFARSNDHYKLLLQDPRAVMLTLGPNGYISPSWMHDKTWGPTWNYASAQFLVDVEFFEQAPLIESHLRQLVDTMEASAPRAPGASPWSVDDMGPRYASLATRVVGFNAAVREVRARFKLGQDERDAILQDLLTGLSFGNTAELQAWTRDFNPGRG